MVIPNLLPVKAIHWISHPQDWFQKDSNSCGELYYSKYPVPGIYTITSSKKRYLMAIKPNTKRDTECIFRSPLDLGTVVSDFLNTELHLYKSKAASCISGSTSRSRSSSDATLIGSTLSTTRAVSFVDAPNTTRERLRSPIRPQSLKQHYRKIEKCDINGYKALKKPLRIKFSRNLQRWMFKAEIEERTITTKMCMSPTCMEKHFSCCGKGVWRDFIALDDAFSWTLVSNKRPKSWLEKNILYCVDETTQCMRRQSVLEATLSKTALYKALEVGGRSVFISDAAEHMSILRYLGLGPIEDTNSLDSSC